MSRQAPLENGVRGSKRYLNATPTVVLASSAVALMHVRRLARGAAEVDLGAVAALGDLDVDAVLLGVVDAVAVGGVLALPLAVRDRRQRLAHPLGGGVARRTCIAPWTASTP